MIDVRLTGLLLVGLLGCGDTPDDAFVSEYFEIEPSDSEVLCRGLLEDMEAQFARVTDVLDLPTMSPFQIEYGPSAVEKHCSIFGVPDIPGCTVGLLDRTIIATGYSALYHEIVHGVRRGNGKHGSNFFEEGIAEVLSGFRPFPYIVEMRAADIERGPKFLAMLSGAEIKGYDYAIAGHFMSWLFAEFGDTTVAEFLNDDNFGTDVEAVFAGHFGMSLEAAETLWRTSSEVSYTWGNVCDPARDLAWDGSAIEFTGRVDCDAANTIGPSILGTIRARSHCFTPEQAGSLRVEFMATSGAAEFRQQYCTGPGGPLSPEHYQDKKVLAGETINLPCSHCTWEAVIATELDAPIDFVLRLSQP